MRLAPAIAVLCMFAAGCTISPEEQDDAQRRPQALVDAYEVAHGMATSYADSPNAKPEVVLQLARLDMRAAASVRALNRSTDMAATASAVAALTDFAARQSAAAAQ